jgi:hypothetical protein
MRRIAQAFVVVAALAAFPVLAEEGRKDYVPGSERDPFSQTYTGRDPEEVRAEREREHEHEHRKASPCDRTCACGHHHGAAQERTKA